MPTNRDDCPDYLNQFLTHCKIVQDRADRTIEAYYIDLRVFLRYVKALHTNQLDIDINTLTIKDVPFEWVRDFTLSDIYAYINYLHEVMHNTPKTRARKVAALRSFYKYLHVKVHLIDNNPTEFLEMPSIKKSLPKYLTLEESIDLLKNINSTDFPRDYCIITLFLNCGMRLSELVGIDISDIDFKQRTVRLLGKGSKERVVYLNDACIYAINQYLSARNPSPKETKALFLSKRGTRISKRRVEQIVEAALQSAGITREGLSTHKLRHTAATLMYQNGVDTLVLKEILGHASISTTEIYTHLTNENLKKAADKSPLSKVTIDKKDKK